MRFITRLLLPAAALAAFAASGLSTHAATETAPLISADDAYVAEESGGWVIGTDLIAIHLGFGSTGSLRVTRIERPGADTPWNLGEADGATFLLQSKRVALGQGGMRFQQARVDGFNGGVRLQLPFDDPATRLRVTRSYVIYPGSSAVEMWSTFEVDPGGSSLTVSDIGVWQFSAPVIAANWITGLDASPVDGGRFQRRQQAIVSKQPLSLGSTARSSETAVPTIWLDGAPGHILGGLLWSGAWSIAVGEPGSAGMSVSRLSLGDIATTLKAGQPFETPHGFLGAAQPGDTDLASAWQAFIHQGVRHGRPLDASVTYNTWFAYGNRIDEQTMRDEMDRVARLGAELFVLDAGWYAGGVQIDDYTTGLGTWTADSTRFPSGLGALRDYAHSVGLKFGIWVEPERVDTTTLDKPGLAKERYLATTGGRYNAGVRNQSASAAQVCLGDAEAQQWVLNQLVRFLDEVRPDYLKWDNNYWINCDRAGHGHGTADGNLFHVKGLYGILASLRQRYPDMSIEDCASGGHRLDLGMLQYTDTAWVDDVSAPSSHVRHNLEGLNAVFPPAYLLSFVMDDPSEPLHEAPDLDLILRSRMPGVLGFSMRPGDFTENELTTMRRAVFEYKNTRSAIRDGASTLLTPQVSANGSSDPDALETISRSTGDVVIYLFAGEGRTVGGTVFPQWLEPDAIYETRSRRGAIRATGESLMESGFDTSVARSSGARVIILSRQAAPALAADTQIDEVR